MFLKDPQRAGDLLEEQDDPVKLDAHPRREPPDEVQGDCPWHADVAQEPTPAVDRTAWRLPRAVQHPSSPTLVRTASPSARRLDSESAMLTRSCPWASVRIGPPSSRVIAGLARPWRKSHSTRVAIG